MRHLVKVIRIRNFCLLCRAGWASKPIFLKRGMAATIDEWLMAAEYILEGGNSQVIPLSRAAVSVNAHGLMVEVHHEPEKALSDGAQSLYPEQFAKLCQQVRRIYNVFQDAEG